MSVFALIYIFLQKYLVPFLFSIGLFFFVYGIIEYFIIGKGGDEGRAQKGRELFLRSIGWFVLALLVYLVVVLLGWLSSFTWSGDVITPGAPTGGVNVGRDDAVLPVPDVPRR